jgi:hypothetical protein
VEEAMDPRAGAFEVLEDGRVGKLRRLQRGSVYITSAEESYHGQGLAYGARAVEVASKKMPRDAAELATSRSDAATHITAADTEGT